MPRTGPTLLIEGYRVRPKGSEDRSNAQRATTIVAVTPKRGNASWSQKLPKTTSSVHIPKK